MGQISEGPGALERRPGPKMIVETIEARKLHRRARRSKCDEPLALWAWADHHVNQLADVDNELSFAERRVAERFGFSPSLARAIAELAGFRCAA